MAKVTRQMAPAFVPVTVTALMLVCLTLSAMVIAGSESVVDGIAMVAVTAILGLLYGLLAVRYEEQAQRERQDRPGR